MISDTGTIINVSNIIKQSAQSTCSYSSFKNTRHCAISFADLHGGMASYRHSFVSDNYYNNYYF